VKRVFCYKFVVEDVRYGKGSLIMEEKLLQDDDLKDLFAELNEAQEGAEEKIDPEMEASQRRYQEIINKHKTD
jgi:hypothetical protein